MAVFKNIFILRKHLQHSRTLKKYLLVKSPVTRSLKPLEKGTLAICITGAEGKFGINMSKWNASVYKDGMTIEAKKISFNHICVVCVHSTILHTHNLYKCTYMHIHITLHKNILQSYKNITSTAKISAV